MKPVGVVTCIPSADLEASLRFYRDCFNLPDLAIEEEMFTIELNGLSLFVMSEDSFASYTRLVGLPVGFPHKGVGAIYSCAIDDRQEIERILASAQESRGRCVPATHAEPVGSGSCVCARSGWSCVGAGARTRIG